MKELSNVACSVEPSATLAVDTLAKNLKSEGEDVVGFGAGEPDFETPDNIKEAGIRAIHEGKTRYTPAAGMKELREACAYRLKQDFDLDYDPTGWVQNRYPTDIVSSGWLYERSHLIAWSLASVASEPKALMTGTAMFNDPGMTQFEEMVADHMRDYRDHDVLYRVTPDFYQDNLVAYGATMEADCLDCDLAFCAYIANINPGVTINYKTGENWESGTDIDAEDPSILPDAQDYVVNRSNRKFHLPTCRYAESMSTSNREEITAPRSWMMAHGYDPCGICTP